MDITHGGEYEGREDFIEHLESRFLFLAADAQSTLRYNFSVWPDGDIDTSFIGVSILSVLSFFLCLNICGHGIQISVYLFPLCLWDMVVPFEPNLYRVFFSIFQSFTYVFI